MTKMGTTALGALLLLCTLPGCALDPYWQVEGPRIHLQRLLEEWQSERENGGSCASGGRRHPYSDCGRIQAEIERLALDFPAHPEVLLANAVIAFETGAPEKSIDYVDALLDLGSAPPDASVLRGQLAIRQGNLPHARRVLESHARLAPDHAGLRETLASVHYLEGNYRDARRELQVAERLGAPAWRTAYHRGLVAEAEGDPEAAMQHYRSALRDRPDWAAPRSRLRGLESERGL